MAGKERAPTKRMGHEKRFDSRRKKSTPEPRRIEEGPRLKGVEKSNLPDQGKLNQSRSKLTEKSVGEREKHGFTKEQRTF